MRKLIGRFVVVLAFFWAGSVGAMPVTFRFEGYVDPGDRFGNGGDSFELIYTFDSEEADGCSDNTIACYLALRIDSFSWGGNSFDTIGASQVIYVQDARLNYSFHDSYSSRADLSGVQFGWKDIWLQLYLLDSTDTVFSSDALPLNIDLNAFDDGGRILYLSGTRPEGQLGNLVSAARVTSFETVSHIPTPATLALFGLGLAGLGWSRRKQHG